MMILSNRQFCRFIKSKDEKFLIQLILLDQFSFSYIQFQTERTSLLAVYLSSCNYRFVKNKTEKINLQLVKKSGLLLSKIQNQTKKTK